MSIYAWSKAISESWCPRQSRFVGGIPEYSSYSGIFRNVERKCPFWLLFPALQQVQWAVGWEEAIAFLLGVELSALNHLLLDGLLVPLPSGIRQRLKGN